MFKLTRKTTAPGSPIHVMVDQPQGDGDAGLAAGGSFYFYPAGSEDGPSDHHVSKVAADAIMGDPELAKHFDCSPPWGVQAAAAEEEPAAAEEAQPDHASESSSRGRRQRRGQGGDTTEPAT